MSVINDPKFGERIKAAGHSRGSHIIGEMARKMNEEIVGVGYQKNSYLIKTEELKKCIDDVNEILKNNKNERLENILNALNDVYEPVKNYKTAPTTKAVKTFLPVIGECEKSDPESLKKLKEQCIELEKCSLKMAELSKKRDSACILK